MVVLHLTFADLPVSDRRAMLLLALLAPFAGLILCLLLVVAIVYTTSYASLYRLLSSCCGPAGRRRQHGSCGSKTHIGDGEARPTVFSCVSMRGLQIEPEAGVSSVWLAGPVLATCWTRPAMLSKAAEHVEGREAATFGRLQGVALLRQRSESCSCAVVQF